MRVTFYPVTYDRAGGRDEENIRGMTSSHGDCEQRSSWHYRCRTSRALSVLSRYTWPATFPVRMGILVVTERVLPIQQSTPSRSMEEETDNLWGVQNMQAMLDQLRQRDEAMMPYGKTLGFKVESIAAGEAVVSLSCSTRLHNVFGYTHGGAIFSIADTAVGLAHLASIGNDQRRQQSSAVSATCVRLSSVRCAPRRER